VGLPEKQGLSLMKTFFILYSSKWKMVEKRYLTLKEISEYPGISVKGVYNMVNRRELSKILNKIKK
jgi:hypothetical protein